MSNLTFLILNYKNVEDTIKCVNSIQASKFHIYNIVIVDNGSDDGSYEKLSNLYGKTKNFYILKSENNLGFSKGNNLGYEFIKKQIKTDFIIVTNNDVLFPQSDMGERIQEIYKQTGFFVLGPDIYVRHNHEHQSPMMLSLPNKKSIEQELKMYEYYQEFPKKWVVRRRMQDTKNRICQSSKLINNFYCKIKRKPPIDYTIRHNNCCVQGACIIVSKKFIDAENKMFTPEPFLYCEELLLYKKCIDRGYLIIYDPSVQIWHEDSSTMKKINSNAIEKAKFTLPHHVEALKIVLKAFNQQ